MWLFIFAIPARHVKARYWRISFPQLGSLHSGALGWQEAKEKPAKERCGRPAYGGMNEMGSARSFLLAISAAVMMSLSAPRCGWPRTPEGKELVVQMGWGDQVQYSGDQALTTVERLRKFYDHYRQKGVDTILLRVDVFRFARDYEWPEPKKIPSYAGLPDAIVDGQENQWQATQDAVKMDLLKDMVNLAHQEGMKIMAWNTTFDEGMPLDMVYYYKGDIDGQNQDPKTGKTLYHTHDSTSCCFSKFIEAHPECVMIDRTQKKYNWGTLEFAYPRARDYAVGYNCWFLDHYPFDGIYIDFRNEFSHPEFGDEFGFSPPIVEEYKKRFGVDILHDEFDVEAWRRLCGEYITQYIRELYGMVHGRGKTLIVGIPQGNYLGMPNGNQYVDWQGWVKDHIVDGLIIGIISGKFIFPDHIGYGYLTDTEYGIGLPNILSDLNDNYWPLCARYGVKLYVSTVVPVNHGNRLPVSEYVKTKVDGVMIW